MFELPSPAEIQQIVGSLKTGVGLFMPELYLSGLFLVLILLDLVTRGKNSRLIGGATLLGLVGSFFFIAQQQTMPAGEFFYGMYLLDRFAIYFKYFFVISAICAVIVTMAEQRMERDAHGTGEYYALIVAMAIGMIMMVSSADMLMILLSMELVSFPAYILAGYFKRTKPSAEASLKYLIYGAVSSGLMLYGFSLIYGLTAKTNIIQIGADLMTHGYSHSPVMFIASLLILAGFGYKIGAVPFHFWSPDVYEGSPTPITAYLSVASKAAGIGLLIRFSLTAIRQQPLPVANDLAPDWHTIIIVLSIGSMIYGNVVALWQRNVKRMLAYSSIAHAGYILLGLAVGGELAIQATLLYLAAYLIMNYGAFYVVSVISNHTGSEELEEYRGLGRKMPVAGAALTVFLISLVGLPPTFGFIGKLLIFSALLSKGSIYLWLALIGIMTSVISLYYYMQVPLNMYLRASSTPDEQVSTPILSQVVMAILMLLTLYFGLFFTPIADFARHSASIFGVPTL